MLIAECKNKGMVPEYYSEIVHSGKVPDAKAQPITTVNLQEPNYRLEYYDKHFQRLL